jgi:beta-xylosidase
VYTDVKVTEGAFKDMTNYLTTAKDIRGPWSDPIKLNGVGFDASLFHDDDGGNISSSKPGITGSTITPSMALP